MWDFASLRVDRWNRRLSKAGNTVRCDNIFFPDHWTPLDTGMIPVLQKKTNLLATKIKLLFLIAVALLILGLMMDSPLRFAIGLGKNLEPSRALWTKCGAFRGECQGLVVQD